MGMKRAFFQHAPVYVRKRFALENFPRLRSAHRNSFQRLRNQSSTLDTHLLDASVMSMNSSLRTVPEEFNEDEDPETFMASFTSFTELNEKLVSVSQIVFLDCVQGECDSPSILMIVA
jgi:hypothetical protein